jgi:hypothetical protein
MELDDAMDPDLGSSTGITSCSWSRKRARARGGVSDEERRREAQAWDASEEAQEAEQLVLSYEIDLANPSGGLKRRGLEYGVEALA